MPPAASSAAEVEGFTVFSTADLRRLAALEAERTAIGCDDTTCLTEIADAMGAEQVLYGSLSRLGTTTTVALSLYTASTGETERRFVDVASVDALPRELRAQTTSLLRGAGGQGPSSIAVGLVVGGGVVAALGAGGIVVGELLSGATDTPGDTKVLWQWVGRAGIAAAVVGAGAVVVGLIVGGAE